MREKKNNKINRLELADLLKGKTKFQLYTYLEMYGKLSLTKIAKKLNKSKSTVYEHLKVLHEIGLVKI
ncbi:MAG: helix-turn-helix transcriptional regulator, partial [Candidatus Lokiarchaeota archaeon]|nr:helix-turn-helix transcriptional regulator [Candidatus Lokiarchaeota archaeon]